MEQQIEIHNNDKFLLAGDACWFVWNLYGLYLGVPLIWGLLSITANIIGVFLLLSKYYDTQWKKEIIHDN